MKVTVNDTTLIDIADAIREKAGNDNVLYPSEMGNAIRELPEGGGGNEPTDEELVITGDCSYRFANGGWDWVLNRYGDRMTTTDIATPLCMFQRSTVMEIPFQINVTDAASFSSVFSGMKMLEVCPKIRGAISWSTSTAFSSMVEACQKIRSLDNLFTPEMLDGFSSVKVTSQYSTPKPPNFSNCFSLRSAPSWWYKFTMNEESTAYPATSYTIYNNGFSSCYALDEILNIPVLRCTGAQSSNMFNRTFSDCYRAKSITFETNDGIPIKVNWKSQVIDLSQNVGWSNYFPPYNSGITTDKEVKNDATYQALKNDPDWYAQNYMYSRYDGSSAIDTIYSLPDTSEYLASSGGTNTIKFTMDAGMYTDGGAIRNLPDTVIARAADKGWTVAWA